MVLLAQFYSPVVGSSPNCLSDDRYTTLHMVFCRVNARKELPASQHELASLM